MPTCLIPRGLLTEGWGGMAGVLCATRPSPAEAALPSTSSNATGHFHSDRALRQGSDAERYKRSGCTRLDRSHSLRGCRMASPPPSGRHQPSTCCSLLPPSPSDTKLAYPALRRSYRLLACQFGYLTSCLPTSSRQPDEAVRRDRKACEGQRR